MRLGAEPACAGYDDQDSFPLIFSTVLGNSFEVLEALQKAGCQDGLDAPASSAFCAEPRLHTAVKGKKMIKARGLLEAGADPTAADAKGLTPLHVASIGGDVPMMRRVVAIDGVDLEARTTAGLNLLHIGTCKPAGGNRLGFSWESGAALVSPPYQRHPYPFLEAEGRRYLFAAVEQSTNKMINLLIDASADSYERRNGWSVICAAARAGSAFAVRALYDSDGGAQALRVLGRTLLHVAAKGDIAHIARDLLDHSADVASVDGEGQDPSVPPW
eukprot:g4178.t1